MTNFTGFQIFVESVDAEEAKTVILNALEANPGAVYDPVANFKKYKDLLDVDKNPQIASMIDQSGNRGAILKAIANAPSTDLSIADLISLFTAPADDKLTT